jgi:hypothetical protein|tara:strand:+ start:315 stop:644 length:330 start_codon:yes stop_codon:yes gene_type:complete
MLKPKQSIRLGLYQEEFVIWKTKDMFSIKNGKQTLRAKGIEDTRLNLLVEVFNMADEWLNEWMNEFSTMFHAMEEYQGQTEFLSEKDFKMFNMVKEVLIDGLKKVLKLE